MRRASGTDRAGNIRTADLCITCCFRLHDLIRCFRRNVSNSHILTALQSKRITVSEHNRIFRILTFYCLKYIGYVIAFLIFQDQRKGKLFVFRYLCIVFDIFLYLQITKRIIPVIDRNDAGFFVRRILINIFIDRYFFHRVLDLMLTAA